MSTNENPAPVAAAAAAAAAATKTIKEGSVVMEYPADQESAVFYNPVQVQNRDLSILMITLYGERRAKQMAIKQHQQSLRQQQQEQQQPTDETKEEQMKPTGGRDGGDNTTTTTSNHFKEQMDAYEATLDPSQAVQALYQENSSNGLCILDALAASGLRSLRYWKEIPGVHHVTINDLDSAAGERAKTNLRANQLQDVEIPQQQQQQQQRHARGICIVTGDATATMYNSRPTTKIRPGFLQKDKSWDVIDLDPYGSAAPFLDAALQAVTNGGLICCTCTDMAALGGSRPEVCVGRYGAMPIQRATYLHEMALRILLQSMAVTAAKYGRTIQPLLSVGMDFYVRVFVMVNDDKAGVNNLSQYIGYVYQSTQCQAFQVVSMGQKGGKNNTVTQPGRAPLGGCPETGAGYKIAGPIWTGPLHDPEIIQTALDRLAGKSSKSTLLENFTQLLATKDRLRGLLLSCRDELNDAPLFYRMRDGCKLLHVSAPPLQMVRYALVNAGYRVSGFHKDPEAVKTNAPSTVIMDILRTWHQQESKKQKNNKLKPPPEGSVPEKILSRPITTIIDFTKPKKGDLSIMLSGQNNNNKQPTTGPNGDGDGDEKNVKRFPHNPPHWGPKKATTGYKRKANPQPPPASTTTTATDDNDESHSSNNKKRIVQAQDGPPQSSAAATSADDDDDAIMAEEGENNNNNTTTTK